MKTHREEKRIEYLEAVRAQRHSNANGDHPVQLEELIDQPRARQESTMTKGKLEDDGGWLTRRVRFNGRM